MKKRGISAVVATVLIILITIAAVTILWTTVIPIVQNSLEFSSLDGRVDIVTSEGYTSYDVSNDIASVQIQKGTDGDLLTHMRIIFYFDGDSVSGVVNAPNSNGKEIYYFNLSDYGEPNEVAVAPIFTQGMSNKEGEVFSRVKVSSGEIDSLAVTLSEFSENVVFNSPADIITSYFSVYPVSYSNTFVKSTSSYSSSYYPYRATDPSRSLVGSWSTNSWIAQTGKKTNQRFHIDLGGSYKIYRIYYENTHNNGGSTNSGAKDFTFWGSNEASAFNSLIYSSDTGWTQITGLSQSYFDEHVSSNVADPKYIEISGNIVPYRYYAFKFANAYGGTYMSVRRIELQSGS